MDNLHSTHCCADCGSVAGGGAGLKACTSCRLVKYCNVKCQKNHWPKHKNECKQRAAEIRDEALFKDPPAKEDCPICFLPMPTKLISCMTLPPATMSSVPISDYAEANEVLADMGTEQYYSCCGKSVCGGCIYSLNESGNNEKCPFCKSDRTGKTDEGEIEELMKRVEVNDAGSMMVLADRYYNGEGGLHQDWTKAIELHARSAELGSSGAHAQLGSIYNQGGDLKKAKFHYEAAAMAGHGGARNNLGDMEYRSGKRERAVKHLIIAASAGCHAAMQNLLDLFKHDLVSLDEIESTLTAYNNSCAQMRSESRDKYISKLKGSSE